MKILKITLENFKGQKSFQMDLNPDVTRIYGRNRSGKTTLADAICWCLFGKDSHGSTKFSIKTLDENGVEIPHLPHSVTLELDNHTITRSLVEKWAKPYGASETVLAGHTTYYYIDGAKVTTKEWNELITSIVSEETFKALTTPSYFPNLKWDEQRRILTQICGEITPEQVANGDHTFDALLGILKEQTLERHLEHLNYQIKNVKAALDQIPIRVEEVTRMMPDIRLMPFTLDEAKEKLKEAQEKKDSLLKTGQADAKQYSDKILFLNKRKNHILQGALNESLRLKTEAETKVNEVKHNNEIAKVNQDALTKKVNSTKEIIRNMQIQLDGIEDKKEDIRSRWSENAKQKLHISEEDTLCPTCGQPLPQEKLEETVKSMKERFNNKKAETFKSLTDEAERVKKEEAGIIAIIQEYEELISTTEEKIQSYKILPVPELEKTPTSEELLEQNPSYSQIIEELEEIERKMNNIPTPDTSKYDDLIETCNGCISRREREKDIQSRIDSLDKEQSDLNKQLTALESQYDIATDFRQKMGDMLEEEVNKHFKMVKFRLFRQLINGSREPYCEATVNGVPYSDLNSADKVNAGIDIINTLSEYYQVSVPLVVDNAESINNIIETKQQRIELYVSEDDTLRKGA